MRNQIGKTAAGCALALACLAVVAAAPEHLISGRHRTRPCRALLSSQMRS